MNHPIHSLLSPQSVGGTNQQQQQQAGSKQHPMQLHHTLHHPHQQPLVNQHQQTMLHFHQTLHHPYSSLHHSQAAPILPPPPPPPQQQANSTNQHSATLHNNSTFSGANQQQPQSLSSHQQQQQQQYNMNSSDYSSSTYHIYDQISDLIIIKQQRLERKRQQEHRRKVILLGFAAALLVGALLFLVLQALMPQQAASSSQQQRSFSADTVNSDSPAGSLEDPQLDRPAWTPQPGNSFDSSKFQVQAGIRLPNQQQTVNKVIPVQQQGTATNMMMPDSLLPCSGHGTVIMSSSSQQQAAAYGESSSSASQSGPTTAACKCDPGFWGERCELSATYQPQSNPLLSRCLLTNCNGNGQCNALGRCQCFGGFFGPQCEFRLPSASLQPMLAASSSSVMSPSISSQSSAVSQSQQSAGASSSSAAAAATSHHQDAIADQQMSSCPNNCNGNGQCTSQGLCKCYPGFAGDFCQERDLCLGQSCSNQGVCLPQTGTCQCKFGFRGNQCEVRDDQQLQRLFNCSSHGKFDYQERKCNCDLGFAGLDCSEERCELANGQQQTVLDCGSNGLFDCRQGKCICQDGYSGDQCQIQQCSAQCLRNGRCLDGVCVCQQQGFYGKHCSLNGCPNQCSGRGQCVRVSSESSSLAVAASSSSSSVASSSTGNGDNSGQQQAAQQQQQQEWKCQCQPGSTGDDCGISVERQCDDGIDNDRDGLVDCADSECCSDRVCQNSTLCMKSPDPLDILMRKQPPPPTSSFFQRMQFLIEKFSSQIYSNPKDFNDSRASVIRGRVSYLKQGVTGVRVSVAGQINLGITLTREGGYFDLMVNGGGAVVIEFRREPFATKQKAVRVPWNEIVLMDPVELSLDAPSGGLDVIINSPLSANLGSPLPEPDVPSCSAHNYRLMRPQIVAAPKSSRKSQLAVRAKLLGNQQQSTSRAIILRDSGVVQQSILLPGSSSRDIKSVAADANQSVSLIYISSKANEFMSTITLQLTPPASSIVNTGNGNEQFKLPPELKLIHLKIVIEGNLFEQIFEPQTNLSFTYAWNRRNVYRQKSFGLSTASVSVGYEYYDCRHIIWSARHLQLAGHDLSISDIGQQWNLNIHHRYNYRDSILQRGDGQNFNLKTDKPKIVQTLMGDGYQRQATCPYCDGASSPAEQRLLKPQALVSGPDGSLYVGDFNMIRKIELTSASSQSAAKSVVVRTILDLPPARVPSKYSLALNLADQRLFMSDIDRHQIYLIREQGKQHGQAQLAAQAAAATSSQQAQLALDSTLVDNSSNSSLSLPEDNLIPVVGSGIRCQLNDRANCGDGQPARLARLNEPRAMVFDLNNRMFIADGPNVRMVDADNKIYTILGDYGASRHTKFPCSGEAIPMHKFVPRRPLDLAMNPLDDTLHLLDDNVVYKITQDKRVQIVAGRLAHCPPTAASSSDHSSSKANGKQLRATEIFLQSAQSIAFGQNGDLFISEDDPKQMISRVLLVSPDEDTISLYAGLPIDASLLINKSSANSANGNSQQVSPTVDSVHVDSMEAELLQQQQQQQQHEENKQRSSNILPLSQTIRASDYKFNSVAAITVDQQGNLIVADRLQLRVLSIEPDLPQMNAAGEYELQSPDNGDELLVFNRYGHHIATREISSGQSQRTANKYTFSYNVNTSFGQLASVGYSTGNKISIYRDGPHHSVKMIETAFGGQCKMDISRNGQVHSISTIAPNTTKTNFAYHVDGGLLKQSRDQASGEVFDFSYDEFGRAVGIQHSSPRLPAPIDCRTTAAAAPAPATSINSRFNSNFISQHCSALIVAE